MTVSQKNEALSQTDLSNYDARKKEIIQARKQYVIKRLGRHSADLKNLAEEFSNSS